MSLRYVVRVLLLAGLAPSAAMALGLGDIHLNSQLNAPLRADIDLSASAEELDGLKVGLASRDTFARYGLDYPSFLGSITLSTGKDAAGRNVIHLRSSDAITEPFATLLVEANWARGRLVREYTVLLDPPAFTGATGNPAAVASPEAPAPERAGAVQRPEPAAPQQVPQQDAAQPASTATAAAAAQPPAAPPVPAAPVAASAATGDYSVRRGDTLSAIVAHHYNNGQRDRALVAAFNANPAAFGGNMNILKAGVTLHLPDADAVAAVGPAEASREVLSQFRAWSPARASGQLKLVAPSPPPAPAPAPTPKPAPAKVAPAPAPVPPKAAEPLAAQVKPAAQPGKSDASRLLELKNAELARLQALQAKPVAPPPVAAKPEPAKVAPPPKVEPAKVEPPKPEAAKPIETPQAAAPKPLPKPVATPAAESGGLVDLLIENWLYLAAVLVVMLGAVVGFVLARKRQGQRMERTFENFTSPPPEPMSRAVRASESTTPIKTLAGKDDQGFLVEESGTHEILALDEKSLGAPVASESAIPIDSTISLEQGDPLAEADFHMAYGLYDQAADLVRLGIAREPGRHELKLKLLEVYFVWGNKNEFLQLAREFSTQRASAPAGEWEKVLIMGRQIAPDDPLFSSKDKVTGAAAGGVDLNLEGGQNHVDFDLLGEPMLAASPPSDRVDLDLGAALSVDAEATGESPALGDTGVDFILDDPQRGADGTGITRELPNQAVSVEFSDIPLSGDAPTVEQPRMREEANNTLRTKIDASARALLAGAEQTSELALDDLGLDLSADATGLHSLPPLDATGNMPGMADSAPTQLTSLDEDTRTLLARAAGESGAAGKQALGETREMPAINPGTSGTWLISDQDFSEIMPLPDVAAGQGAGDAATQVLASPYPASPRGFSPEKDPTTGDTSIGLGLTNQIETLKAGSAGVDLDLAGMDGNASTGKSPALDLDVGAAAAQAENRFGDTQRLDPITIQPPANTVEPATMSEVGTKLDLARAYMDMGDPEGARSILEEVLSEGSASQKTEARRLIDSLPG